MDTLGFMHKYFDWATFEGFVKELYEKDGDVVVERDVVEVDRHGAKRQVDVKITLRTRFHTFVTLVECKRWKDRVGRDRVDVLAASIEGLGANKGAIFTTTGFEEGAVAYAKSKGIDLFVVRDLLPQEWGLPGRHILLLHAYVGGGVS
jgi:restriction endonuclease Mrr